MPENIRQNSSSVTSDPNEKTRLLGRRTFSGADLSRNSSIGYRDGFLGRILPEGSVRAGVFNIASATLGAGALTLPVAFKQSGIVMGLIWLAIGMLATIYSIKLLIDVLQFTKYSRAWRGPRYLDSYEDLSLHIFGKKIEYCVEAQIIVFCYGTAIAYVVAVGDILDPIRVLGGMPDLLSGHYGRKVIMIAFWFVLMLPLSFVKNVNSLRFSSMLGVISILFLVVATIKHCIQHRFVDDWSCGDDYGGKCTKIEYAAASFDAVLTIPLVLLAYTCQVNVFSIYQELKDPSPAKMMKISWLGMAGLCFVIYALMGTAGYLDFEDVTKGNILKNFQPKKDPVIAISFIAITLTVVVAFPLVVFPCRDSIFGILYGPKQTSDRVDLWKDSLTNPDKYEVASVTSSHVYMPGPGAAGGLPRIYKKPPSWVHYAVSFSISFSALLFALFVPGIQVVFFFLGGVCSSFLCLVLPAWFMKRVIAIETDYFNKGGMNVVEEDVESEDDDEELWDEPRLPKDALNRFGIELLFWGGIVAGVGSTAGAIYNQITG
eukprot:Sspe_Gene.66236::Locus_39145_Transcript_1_1_Confidence_1.000_Length_1913::g.66236::m.66236